LNCIFSVLYKIDSTQNQTAFKATFFKAIPLKTKQLEYDVTAVRQLWSSPFALLFCCVVAGKRRRSEEVPLLTRQLSVLSSASF
jgi:hypothetical protein